MTATGTARDTGRQRVYDAENLVMRIVDRSAQFPTVEVAGSSLVVPVERRFGSVIAVQQYVDGVLALNWVRSAWERAAVPVIVRERRSDGRAHYERPAAVIAVPAGGGSWALRELVVLHELAHHLATDDQAAMLPAHGPAFTDRLLTLVGEIVGPEAALLLRVTLADVGRSAG